MSDYAIVDIERLVVQALLDGTLVVAIAGDAIETELEEGFTPPALQITRLPGIMVDDSTARLERALLQVQAWGTTKAQAFDLAAAAAIELKALTDVDHGDLGVVTETIWQQTPWWNPDGEADTPRYTMTIAVFAHPS